MSNDEDRSVPASTGKGVRVVTEWSIEFSVETLDVPEYVFVPTYTIAVDSREANSREDAVAYAICKYIIPLAKAFGVDPYVFTVGHVKTRKFNEVVQ